MKTIGIIGAGHIGKALAGQLQKNNIPVLISNTKGPTSLATTVAKLGKGVTAVTTVEAADAEIVVLALPWWEVKSLTGLRDWTGKIVIDVTNEFLPDHKIDDLRDKASTEIVLSHLPGARIVKAFNTLFAERIAANPVIGEGRRVAFVAGDDAAAKAEVVDLVKAIGFAPIDMGSLAVGGKYLGAKGVFSGLHLVKL